MKHKIAWLVITALITGIALSCGPGNSGSPKGLLQGPYKGSSFLVITGGGTTDLTSNGWRWTHTTEMQISDTETKFPVPNISVNATFYLVKNTLSDYSYQPFVLVGDDTASDFSSASVKAHSDFNGKVHVSIIIPAFFDGELSLVVGISNSFVTDTIKVKFDSGTTCTDGLDNNKNGLIDYADPACPNGYSVEPEAGTALAAAQSPAGKIATGGTVSIGVTGGIAPYSFSSSSPGVATINPSTGIVTAIGPGFATITVTDATSIITTVNISVGNVAAFTVTPPTASLVLTGATATLTANILDAASAALVGLPVTWGTSAGGCASVSTATANTATVTDTAPVTTVCAATITGSITTPALSGTSAISVNNP